MRRAILASLTALVLASSVHARHVQDAVSSQTIAAVLADPARKADAAADARRKAADILAFSEVRPGGRVLDLIPGGGYFSRIFSAAVGPQGRVYAVFPIAYERAEPGFADKLREVARQPHYRNIEVLLQPADALAAPAPVDLVFTSQNYHDYPDKFMGNVDPATLDRQVFDALRPGGLFVVIDHAAEAGSGMRDTDTLHRIDPAVVRQQAEAAGFVLDGQLDVLRNPADTHARSVFDKSIRGRTDQFVYRFRKPAR
ncbi:methyltransferase [Frateuria sp. Soil773]|uniref:class I SAM-dependent methyltransferase n=1 Tax=Frateuria sp. Soil773 TaxID=1736407 RepID=UPI0006FE951A|nr:class I SAM-dependent methyltransferase [Frateuria sp. Soil773]KRE99551.1 methyltransferase [Frateuria sp. Soil773]